MRRNVAGQKFHFSLFKSGARIANPTRAAADFLVDKDNAGQVQVSVLPTTDAAGLCTWSPSQAETDAVYVTFLANDAGAEWEPLTVEFLTTPETSIEAILVDTAEIGAAGAGLTALGDTRIANLDATVGSRSTYAGGAVASVTGSVGSVAGGVVGSVGSVAGNVVGSVGSVTGLTASNLDATISSRAAALTALDKTVWTDAKAVFLDGSVLGVPALVWSYATRTLTSLSALVASIAASVWTYATRTLTSTAAATTAATTGSTLTITKAAGYSATLSGLTISASWTKMYLTLKKAPGYADASATIQIVESSPGAVTDGLLYLNGAASTAAYASLTVDQAAGTVAIVIADEATDDLTNGETGSYDVKLIISAAESQVLTAGTYSITSAQTLAIT